MKQKLNKKLRLADVRTSLNAMGVVLSRDTAGDFRVWVHNAKATGPMKEGEVYFTDNLQDAFDTGKHMAADELARKHAVPGHPVAVLTEHINKAIARGETPITEQRETFVQYLRRVGADYRRSDSDSATADDYDMVAKRIEELEDALQGLIDCPDMNMDSMEQESLNQRDNAVAVVENKFQHLN